MSEEANSQETSRMHTNHHIEDDEYIARPLEERVGRDQVTELLLTGRTVFLVPGFDYEPEGPGAGSRPHARRLRDRARSRGLKQDSVTFGSGSGVLAVQWYRQTPGDLFERDAPADIVDDRKREA
jgi:hypothetical protein